MSTSASTKTQNRPTTKAPVSRWEEASEYCIQDHPGSAAMVTFVAGFGAGLALAALMMGDRRKHVDDNIAQRLGHQVLDSLAQVLPSSVSNRLR